MWGVCAKSLHGVMATDSCQNSLVGRDMHGLLGCTRGKQWTARVGCDGAMEVGCDDIEGGMCVSYGN